MVVLNIRGFTFIKIISINFEDKQSGRRWEVKAEEGGEEGEREGEKKEEGRKNN